MLRQTFSISSIRAIPRGDRRSRSERTTPLLAVTLAVLVLLCVLAPVSATAAPTDRITGKASSQLSKKVDSFVARHVGKAVDYDGIYGAQCVDLFNFYNRDVVGGGFLSVDFAYQLWTRFPAPASNSYIKVGASKPPRKGDVAIYAQPLPGSDGAGHVAIVLGNPGGRLAVFHQNWPWGSSSHKQQISKAHLLGYLRPKSKGRPKPKGNAPIGSFDSAVGLAGGKARVRGWTIDPDVPNRPTTVHLYVDGEAGSGARGINLGKAKLKRLDVAKRYRAKWPNVTPNHGFDKTITGLSPGNHKLFLYAIDAGGGGGNKLISSKVVTVPAPPPSKKPKPTIPRPTPATGKVLLVDNRVTNGATQMREDPTPVRLTTKPWINCGSRGCNVAGTERRSGQTYDKAICQTTGERTTNGHDGSSIDDRNPGLFTSTRYYKVKLTNGKTGFVSEVWINKKHRGGLGLPKC